MPLPPIIQTSGSKKPAGKGLFNDDDDEDEEDDMMFKPKPK